MSPINTLRLPPEVTLVITEDDDVFFEELPGMLSPKRDIQHANESTAGASLLDLPHYRKDPTMNTIHELKEQVNDLSLDVKRQFLVPINIPSYEDKF